MVDEAHHLDDAQSFRPCVYRVLWVLVGFSLCYSLGGRGILGRSWYFECGACADFACTVLFLLFALFNCLQSSPPLITGSWRDACFAPILFGPVRAGVHPPLVTCLAP